MNLDFMLNRFEESREACAVIAGGGAYTYGDLLQKYQDSLMAIETSSIDRGSVVALCADYSLDAVAMLLALIEKDCIIVPIAKAALDRSKRMELSQCEFLADFTKEAASAETASIKAAGTKAAHDMLLSLRKKGAPGLILFSSGTTGKPKAALHDLSKLMEKFKRPGKTMKTLAFLLFDHIGGFNTLMHTISHGGAVVTIANRRPKEVCELIQEQKIELLPATPTFLNMLLLYRMYEQYDLTSLKMVTYGTEPMPEHTLKLISKLLPHTVFKQTYGLSELGILPTRSQGTDSLWMKVGGEGFETKILDGILFVKAESAMIGYLNAPSPFDEDGWFDTKDQVEEKDGYLRILGRTTDLINVGGEKVYPVEIENVLLQMEGVLDARVFAEKNPVTGNTAACEVLVAAGNNNSDFRRALRNYCGERLEKFKRPTRIILTESELCGDRLKKRH